jgi:hypothetical protein
MGGHRSKLLSVNNGNGMGIIRRMARWWRAARMERAKQGAGDARTMRFSRVWASGRVPSCSAAAGAARHP